MTWRFPAGWEVPAGWADPGEDPETAVRREIEEETGWRAGTISPLTGYDAISGIGDMRFTAFVATEMVRFGDPADKAEATRVEWHRLADVPKLAADGQLSDGPRSPPWRTTSACTAHSATDAASAQRVAGRPLRSS
jgi:8-oxo-dGTP pyrophosphatase MutT (NUDIX family)